MKCFYHPNHDAVGVCISCGKAVCSECKVILQEKMYCNPCADKMFSGRFEAARAVASSGWDNTSGRGRQSILPGELSGWNWGAFLMNWIWAIGNNVWIGLLALIPYAGFIMAIILGVKGSEWAWQSKKWDNIEHFKRTQSTWTKWGVGLIVLSVIVGIVVAIGASEGLWSSGYW